MMSYFHLWKVPVFSRAIKSFPQPVELKYQQPFSRIDANYDLELHHCQSGCYRQLINSSVIQKSRGFSSGVLSTWGIKSSSRLKGKDIAWGFSFEAADKAAQRREDDALCEVKMECKKAALWPCSCWTLTLQRCSEMRCWFCPLVSSGGVKHEPLWELSLSSFFSSLSFFLLHLSADVQSKSIKCVCVCVSVRPGRGERVPVASRCKLPGRNQVSVPLSAPMQLWPWEKLVIYKDAFPLTAWTLSYVLHGM